MSSSDRSQVTPRPLSVGRPGTIVSDYESDTLASLRRPYCGSTSTRPRYGVACTSPKSIGIIASRRRRGLDVKPSDPVVLSAIALDPGPDAHLGVACWDGAQKWLHDADFAFRALYPHISRHLDGGLSRESFMKVCKARASYADYRTGRDCRPTNKTLMAKTGLGKHTVQRATKAMRLLGLATEVLRGRLRTLNERMASWRQGDKSRGWASVYALHSPAMQFIDALKLMAPHLVGSFLSSKPSVSRWLLPATSKAGRCKGRAPRDRAKTKAGRKRTPPPPEGVALALKWRQSAECPRWAYRYSPNAWGRVLAEPARHGWTAADLNQLVTDYLRGGGRITDPRKPISVLAFVLGRHSDLDDRPAYYIELQAAEALAHERQLQRDRAVTAELERQRRIDGQQAAKNSDGAALAREIAARSAGRRAERQRQERQSAQHEVAAAAARAQRGR